jgi:hypothetical protein
MASCEIRMDSSLGEIDRQPVCDLLRAPRLRPPTILSAAVTATDPTHGRARHGRAVRPFDEPGEAVLYVVAQRVVGGASRRRECVVAATPPPDPRSTNASKHHFDASEEHQARQEDACLTKPFHTISRSGAPALRLGRSRSTDIRAVQPAPGRTEPAPMMLNLASVGVSSIAGSRALRRLATAPGDLGVFTVHGV